MSSDPVNIADDAEPPTGEVQHQTMGRTLPHIAWTEILFMDGSTLRVCWDGQHEVSGLYGDPVVTVYQPYGRRLHIPLHRIAMIEHQERTSR